MGNLVSLHSLSFLANQLTGPFPSELGNLVNVETLYLGSNQLTGPVPPELGNLVNLRELSLDANQLTGSIPLSFANLADVDWFWFHLNSGLCAGEDAVIRNWLDGIRVVLAGPDCSPSIRLSVNPSNLVEGQWRHPRHGNGHTDFGEQPDQHTSAAWWHGSGRTGPGPYDPTFLG